MEKETEDIPEPLKVGSWLDTVEIASKVGIAAIAVAYIIGLLILNLHIRKYGVYYFSFLQIKYVTAGILWAFLVGLIYCFFYLILSIFKSSYTVVKQKGIKLVLQVAWQSINIFYIFALFFCLSLVLQILSNSQLDILKLTSWIVIGVLVFNVIALFIIGTKMRNAIRHLLFRQQTKEIDDVTRRAVFFDVFYNIIVFVSALSLYSNYVFPHISPVFGGGKKQKAEFIIKSEEVETIKVIGIPMKPASRNLGPLEVIFEASDFFLVAPPPGFNNNKVKALRIRKDMIDAAFYITEEN